MVSRRHITPAQFEEEWKGMHGVPLDKSEGVVKRHFFAAMPFSTACVSEWRRTEALKLSR